MAVIRFQSSASSDSVIELECSENTSVLDSLLAAKVQIPHSCRAGLCQACLCQTNDISRLNAEAVDGLSDLQRRNHQFLACQCIPSESLEVRLAAHNSDWLCELVGKRYLSGSVVELSFQAEGLWSPGQHLLLWMDDIHARPYSVSNLVSPEKVMSFLVQRHPQGLVSQWCYDQLQLGERVRLSPPQGHFYLEQEAADAVVLIAQGSGLGVAVGIAQQALVFEGDACVDLFWAEERELQIVGSGVGVGNVTSADPSVSLSLLSYFAGKLDGVHVHRRDLGQDFSGGLRPAAHIEVQASLKASGIALRGKKIFIVGGERFVAEMSRACFFAGAARTDISTEVFFSGNGDDRG